VSFVIIGLWWAFWIIGLVCLYGSGKVTMEDPSSPYPRMDPTDKMSFVYLWLVIGLWINSYF